MLDAAAAAAFKRECGHGAGRPLADWGSGIPEMRQFRAYRLPSMLPTYITPPSTAGEPMIAPTETNR